MTQRLVDPSRSGRFAALDVLRGFVMVLMAIDHASEAFNRGRLVTDSLMMWKPGMPLPPGQFLTRWMTHLCAPTFVFLAGAALAISTRSRAAKGSPSRSIDLHIAKRGVLLVAFELLWMSPVMVGPGRLLLQVLYALGGALLFMIPLRRLGDAGLAAIGLGWLVLGEAFVGLLTAAGTRGSVLAAALFSGGIFGGRRLIIAYPVVPWLAIMTLGWVFGRKLVAWRSDGRPVDRLAARVLLLAGLTGLAAFAALRGVNGYGNMLLPREDGSLVQWLHVSKYPPSAAFTCLELGIMAVLLSGLFAVSSRRAGAAFGGPLRTIGQTALFFYLLHIHAMELVARVAGVEHELGLWSAYAGGLAVVVVLYPACVRYRRFKAENPESFARYI